MEVGLRVRDRINRGCAEGAYVFLQHARVALLVGLALNEPSARHLLTLGCFTSFALEQLSLLLMRELLGVLKLKKLPVRRSASKVLDAKPFASRFRTTPHPKDCPDNASKNLDLYQY